MLIRIPCYSGYSHLLVLYLLWSNICLMALKLLKQLTILMLGNISIALPCSISFLNEYSLSYRTEIIECFNLHQFISSRKILYANQSSLKLQELQAIACFSFHSLISSKWHSNHVACLSCRYDLRCREVQCLCTIRMAIAYSFNNSLFAVKYLAFSNSIFTPLML